MIGLELVGGGQFALHGAAIIRHRAWTSLTVQPVVGPVVFAA